MGHELLKKSHYHCMQATAGRPKFFWWKHWVTIKPNVYTGQLPISPRVRMVDVVNQTRVLKQACFCLWKYPPKSVGKLCEVLGQKRYHVGVLDKWTDFQVDWWNPHHFMGIFVQVPFHAFKTRQSCSSLLLGVNKFLNFINRHSKGYLAWNPWKAPLQNLLTRVCKSQLRAMWRRAPFPARALDFKTSKLIHVCWYHLLVESNRQLWWIWSRPQVPLELLLGWKLPKLAILRPFWPPGWRHTWLLSAKEAEKQCNI